MNKRWFKKFSENKQKKSKKNSSARTAVSELDLSILCCNVFGPYLLPTTFFSDHPSYSYLKILSITDLAIDLALHWIWLQARV